MTQPDRIGKDRCIFINGFSQVLNSVGGIGVYFDWLPMSCLSVELHEKFYCMKSSTLVYRVIRFVILMDRVGFVSKFFDFGSLLCHFACEDNLTSYECLCSGW